MSATGEFNPRRLVFEVNYEAPFKAAAGVPAWELNENVWWCLTCGLCEQVCPQAVPIVEIVREARVAIRTYAPGDERFTATETHKNVFPLAFELMLKNPRTPDKREVLRDLVRRNGWIPLEFSETGDLAYFPGCLNLYEHALHYLDLPQSRTAYSVVRMLNMANVVPVLANDGCCGHDAYWSGDFDTFLEFAQRNVAAWKDAGVETILASCAEGFHALSTLYPRHLDEFPFEVAWLPDYIHEKGLFEKVRNHKVACHRRVTIHDPCRAGRLAGGTHYESIRALLESIPHLELVEMPNNRDLARCCGVSTFRNCNEYSRELTRERLLEAASVGADYVVTTCPKCQSHFQCVLQNERETLEGEEGLKLPKVVELFDFLGRVYNYNGLHEPV